LKLKKIAWKEIKRVFDDIDDEENEDRSPENEDGNSDDEEDEDRCPKNKAYALLGNNCQHWAKKFYDRV
jgi:hypothetical protein